MAQKSGEKKRDSDLSYKQKGQGPVQYTGGRVFALQALTQVQSLALHTADSPPIALSTELEVYSENSYVWPPNQKTNIKQNPKKTRKRI